MREAAKSYRLASNLGDARSQLALGRLLYTGRLRTAASTRPAGADDGGGARRNRRTSAAAAAARDDAAAVRLFQRAATVTC